MSMHHNPVWIEAALNGAASKKFQPLIPTEVDDIVEQGIACTEAGAAIIHVHAFDPSGKPTEDADIYTRIIEGIRAHCDAIVYPTIAIKGTAQERCEPLRILGERGLLEVAVVDPGSVNITHISQIESGRGGLLYANPDDHIKMGLELAERHHWRPAYAIYEPGFARIGAAWAKKYSNVKTPVYRLMFSNNLMFGMPPTRRNLEFYADHLAATAPGAPWMISGLDADIEDIMEPSLTMGAHIRVGLEDAPFGCERSNVELVTAAVQKAEASGRKLATPTDVRAYQ